MTTQLQEAHWKRPAWSRDGSRFRFENYVIEPAGDAEGGWFVGVGRHWPAVQATLVGERHQRLEGAKAWARLHRLGVIRRAKLARHAVFTMLGVLLVSAGFEVISMGNDGFVVPAFVAAMVGILITLRESLGFINHLIGDTDFFEMQPQTRLDAFVRRRLERLATVPKKDTADRSQVRIVEPDEWDPQG